ncbi:MAG: DsrE family protein [Candidatus Nezhaarchaeales archaeon]
MKIGLVLNTTPYSFEYTDIVINMAKEAIKKGHEVKVFLFIDGVYNSLRSLTPPLPEERDISSLLKELVGLGVDIKVSLPCATVRGIGGEEIITKGMKYEDISYIGRLVAECDRVVAFSY